MLRVLLKTRMIPSSSIGIDCLVYLFFTWLSVTVDVVHDIEDTHFIGILWSACAGPFLRVLITEAVRWYVIQLRIERFDVR